MPTYLVIGSILYCFNYIILGVHIVDGYNAIYGNNLILCDNRHYT